MSAFLAVALAAPDLAARDLYQQARLASQRQRQPLVEEAMDTSESRIRLKPRIGRVAQDRFDGGFANNDPFGEFASNNKQKEFAAAPQRRYNYNRPQQQQQRVGVTSGNPVGPLGTALRLLSYLVILDQTRPDSLCVTDKF